MLAASLTIPANRLSAEASDRPFRKEGKEKSKEHFLERNPQMSMPAFSGNSLSAPDVQEIYRAAYEKFRQAANWVEFYREIFGVRGLLRQALPLPHQYHQFQQTQEYVEIQRMLAKLRQRSGPIPDEETKVITVRIPRSLYEALRKEAYDHQTSLNKYCISKLVQLLDSRIFSESEDTAPVMTPPEPLPHEPAPVSTPK